MNAAIRVGGSSEFEMFHRALHVSEYRQRLSGACVRFRKFGFELDGLAQSRERLLLPLPLPDQCVARTPKPLLQQATETSWARLWLHLAAEPGRPYDNIYAWSKPKCARLFLLALVAAHCNGAQWR